MPTFNERSGTTTTSLLLTPAQILERSYACGVCGDFLRTKPTKSSAQTKLGHLGLDTLNNVFGTNSIDTIVQRMEDIHAGSTSLVRNPAANKVDLAKNDFSGIHTAAGNRGAKLVTVSVAHVEFYNAVTGSTVYKFPRAVSATKYES